MSNAQGAMTNSFKAKQFSAYLTETKDALGSSKVKIISTRLHFL